MYVGVVTSTNENAVFLPHHLRDSELILI